MEGLEEILDELYIECEHGDEAHRQWLKDKFRDYAERKANEAKATTFKDRLKVEAKELQDKIDKLRAFVESDKLSALGDSQQNMLQAQLGVMITYVSILGVRLKDLE